MVSNTLKCNGMPRQRRSKKRTKQKEQTAPKGHLCTPDCRHTCGEMGGLTERGKPCRRPAGAGVEGWIAGQYGKRCAKHDQVLEGSLSALIPPAVWAMLMSLPPMHQKFVIAYCGPARGSGALAAEEAGYTGNGMSIATMAYKLLAQPQIRAVIDAWVRHLALSSAEVTWQIADLTNVTPEPFMQWNEEAQRLEPALTQETLAAYGRWIREVEFHENGTVKKLRLHNRHDALRDLAKIYKLYSDAPIMNWFLVAEEVQQLSNEDLLGKLQGLVEARDEPLLLPPGKTKRGKASH